MVWINHIHLYSLPKKLESLLLDIEKDTIMSELELEERPQTTEDQEGVENGNQDTGTRSEGYIRLLR